MNITKLLQELDDVAAFMHDHVSRQHMQSLCKQSAAAIRELQAEAARAMTAEHATFLLKLSDGLKELGMRMQSHA